MVGPYEMRTMALLALTNPDKRIVRVIRGELNLELLAKHGLVQAKIQHAHREVTFG
jgi:hypothetical protein